MESGERQRRILVVEREPYWLPELRRQFRRSRIEIESARSWEEAAGRTAHDGGERLTVCEFSAAAGELLDTAATARNRPAGPLVVVLDEASREWEWPLRELGAACVVDELCGGERLAAQCRRLLKRA